MVELRLAALFASLERPTDEGVLTATRVDGAGNFRVARDRHGDGLFLYELPPGSATGSSVRPIHLRHLEYEPRVSAAVRDTPSGSTTQHDFLLLRCRAGDGGMTARFFDVVEALLVQLPPSPPLAEIDRSIRDVVELFRAMADPARRSIAGLWTELLVIHDAVDPSLATAAWHSSNMELHDFVLGPDVVEVKSTTSPIREHDVALEQLAVATGGSTVFASFLLEQSDIGTSADDLIRGIRRRLTTDTEATRRLLAIAGEAMGQDWEQIASVRFDLAAARASLRTFGASSIPCVDRRVPPQVRRVRFSVDLSDTSPMSKADLLRSELGAALWSSGADEAHNK